MTAEEHARKLDALLKAISELRAIGGINEEFRQWHARLMSYLNAVASEFPSSACLCDELRVLKYELIPEMGDTISESFQDSGLPEEQIIAQNYRVFFRNQCDKAVEALRTLRWSINAARRENDRTDGA
jgi:hypothetical protein